MSSLASELCFSLQPHSTDAYVIQTHTFHVPAPVILLGYIILVFTLNFRSVFQSLNLLSVSCKWTRLNDFNTCSDYDNMKAISTGISCCSSTVCSELQWDSSRVCLRLMYGAGQDGASWAECWLRVAMELVFEWLSTWRSPAFKCESGSGILVHTLCYCVTDGLYHGGMCLCIIEAGGSMYRISLAWIIKCSNLEQELQLQFGPKPHKFHWTLLSKIPYSN